MADNLPDKIIIANQVVKIDEDGKKRILQKYQSLTRSSKYFEEYRNSVNNSILEVKHILQKYQLHEDLIYVAVLESHLNPKAISKSGAKGIWQFNYDTAVELGLIYGEYDKRECIKTSTYAAAKYFIRHLKYLKGDYLKIILAHHLGLQGTINYMKKLNTQSLNVINKETHDYLIHYIAHLLVCTHTDIL